MNTEPFYINNKTNFYSIFWEILSQEKSQNIKNKVFIQKRKEALLNQQLSDIIDPIAIRKNLNNRIYLLEKKNKDVFNALLYASRNHINLNMDSKKDQPFNFMNLNDKETIELCSLKQKLELDDNLLIEEEKQNILHKLNKKDHEYLSDYLETKIEHYKKWGTISYRSIGAGIGAVIGSIIGTILFPGLGTSLGAILGGGIGGVLGLMLIGPFISHSIVNWLIPLSNAYNQAKQIKQIQNSKHNESKKLNSKTFSFSEKLETVHQEVKTYLLTQNYSEPYNKILDKFNHKHLNNKFTLKQNALIMATIENTLDNDIIFKNLTIPINLNRKSSTLSQQTRNFQNNIILNAKLRAQTLKV